MMLTAADTLLDRLRAYRASLYKRGHVTGRNGAQHALWPTGVQQSAGEFLRDLVIRVRAATGLETGLGLGLSTLFIVEALLTNVGEQTASHTVIEPNPAGFDHAGIQTLLDSGATQIATVIEQDSTLALPRLVAEGRQVDFAYIDGGHLFEFAFIDIFNALRLVRPGGLIVVDDHWMPSVQTALAFFHTNRQIELELYDPAGPGKRFVGLRVPRPPDNRAWDHFANFGRDCLPTYPWKK